MNTKVRFLLVLITPIEKDLFLVLFVWLLISKMRRLGWQRQKITARVRLLPPLSSRKASFNGGVMNVLAPLRAIAIPSGDTVVFM